MSQPVNPSPPPRGTRRAEAAARTRRRMIDAAHALFLERGFVGTTVPDVAAAADVSVQNVYKVFGNKAGLAKAVFDVAIAGDDEPIAVVERAALTRVREEPDPRRQLELYGQHLAATAPRHVPMQLVIVAAASTDPDAEQVWRSLQQERLRGMSRFAQSLHDRGHLRAGVSVDEARDVLWTYNSAEVFRLLVLERRWSPKRYGRWISHALIAALLS